MTPAETKQPPPQGQKVKRSPVFWLFLATLVLLLVWSGGMRAAGTTTLTYSEFKDHLAAGRVQRVVVDAGEMKGETSGASYTAQGTDMGDLREVRLNLVVRTRREDEEFDGRLQATENRAAAATDGFRRRVYTTTVLPRNLLGRIGT